MTSTSEVSDVERLAFDRDAELRAHRAAAAVAGEQIRAFDLARAVRRLEGRDHAVVGCAERRQPCRRCTRARLPLVERAMQDRLEMVLRHVDDEGIAGLVAEQLGRAPRAARCWSRARRRRSRRRAAPWPAPGRRRRSGGTLRACASGWCRPWCRSRGRRLPRTAGTAGRRNSSPSAVVRPTGPAPTIR